MANIGNDHKEYNSNSTPSICIVGGGISGMCAAIQLKRKLGLETFTIFDTNKDLGGTWLVNTYPGCECDVPIYCYSFSFEPKTDWDNLFANQADIHKYLKDIGKKYDLYSHCHFNHAVLRLTYIDDSEHWKVVVKDLESGIEKELTFAMVICATGLLRYPNIPKIFDNFSGPKMHSALWDSSVETKGKKVGVVGCGTSAIQIIPAIVDEVDQLVSFQRSPAWVYPKPQHRYRNWAKFAFKHCTGLRKAHRWSEFLAGEVGYPIFRTNTLSSHILRPCCIAAAHTYRTLKVKQPDRRNLLKPVDALGCKRPCINSDYYTALSRPNASVNCSRISCVTNDSIITEDGKEERLDVLILATGFKLQEYFHPMEIYGRQGVDVFEKWSSDRPQHYRSIMSRDMPNLFNVLGPGVDVGHNTLVFVVECQVKWMIKVIQEFITRKSKTVCPNAEAQDNYMKRYVEKMKGTIWTSRGCGTTIYTNSEGTVTIKNHDSLISHWYKMRKPKLADLEFVN